MGRHYLQRRGIPLRIVRHLREHPGATKAELLAALTDIPPERVHTAVSGLLRRRLIRAVGKAPNVRFWSAVVDLD